MNVAYIASSARPLRADEEFWRMPEIVRRTGLSKTEIYRRMDAGTFPKSKPYPDSKRVFWLASEVRGWMADLWEQQRPRDQFDELIG